MQCFYLSNNHVGRPCVTYGKGKHGVNRSLCPSETETDQTGSEKHLKQEQDWDTNTATEGACIHNLQTIN